MDDRRNDLGVGGETGEGRVVRRKEDFGSVKDEVEESRRTESPRNRTESLRRHSAGVDRRLRQTRGKVLRE